MEYENVIKSIDNLKYINDQACSGLIGEKEEIENVIEIANSFGYHYTNEDFEGIGLFYKNMNKLQGDMIEIVKNKINLLDNTTFRYWKIYRDFKLWFVCVEINIPNLTEEEKINNPEYIGQLVMNEENKELTQKSYDLGNKICGLYLSYYIKDKSKRLEYCENLLNELTNKKEILKVKGYMSKLKKIYKL
jgi:hypothetical protein